MPDIDEAPLADMTCAGGSRAVQWAVGPNGLKLMLADLPPPDTVRWTPRRKAEVLAAINGGLISADEACARYDLSFEEYSGWEAGAARWGRDALRATKAQRYREGFARDQRG